MSRHHDVHGRRNVSGGGRAEHRMSDAPRDEVFVEGITSVTHADIKVAGDRGYKIKLLGVAQRSADGIEQRAAMSVPTIALHWAIRSAPEKP